jgi:hypothetical protein
MGRWWLADGNVLLTSSWGPPGKEGAGGAHRGWQRDDRASGRLMTVAFLWRAAPMIIVECSKVLQLEGGKGVRKWRLLEETGGSRRR